MITGSIRIALYCEGAGERGSLGIVAPGKPLPEHREGSAHKLLRRIVADSTQVPAPAVQFVEPFKYRQRIPHGADLIDPEVLRRVLNPLSPALRPTASIVLVDEDGDERRQALLAKAVANTVPPASGALAQPEYEAWLLCDSQAIAQTFGRGPPQMPSRWAPRTAKQFLSQLCGDAGQSPLEARSTLAAILSLERLYSAARSVVALREWSAAQFR